MAMRFGQHVVPPSSRLAEVLRGIEEAGLPSRARKRLQYIAVERAFGKDNTVPQDAASSNGFVIEEFERMLRAASNAAGKSMTSATAVRSWLASRGRGDVAKRVRKLSNLRNAVAHPDTRLVSDIESAAGRRRVRRGAGRIERLYVLRK